MSSYSSSCSHQPLFVWIPFFREEKPPNDHCFALGTQLSLFLSLSHLAIWLLYTSCKFEPCLHLLHVCGAFFLCSYVHINWNNTVIDLTLTFLELKMNCACAENTIIPTMIIPNSLKHFNNTRVRHWNQTLGETGHICSFLHASSKALTELLIFFLIDV